MGNLMIDGLDAAGVIIRVVSLKVSLEEFLAIARSLSAGGEVVQLFDPDSIIDKNHVVAAYLNSVVAFRDGVNRSKSPDTEMLLFAAMTKQISDAVRLVGAKTGEMALLFATKRSYARIMKYIRRERMFVVSKRHKIEAAAKFGISADVESDIYLPNRMSLIKLES